MIRFFYSLRDKSLMKEKKNTVNEFNCSNYINFIKIIDRKGSNPLRKKFSNLFLFWWQHDPMTEFQKLF